MGIWEGAFFNFLLWDPCKSISTKNQIATYGKYDKGHGRLGKPVLVSPFVVNHGQEETKTLIFSARERVEPYGRYCPIKASRAWKPIANPTQK